MIYIRQQRRKSEASLPHRCLQLFLLAADRHHRAVREVLHRARNASALHKAQLVAAFLSRRQRHIPLRLYTLKGFMAVQARQQQIFRQRQRDRIVPRRKTGEGHLLLVVRRLTGDCLAALRQRALISNRSVAGQRQQS